MAYISQVLTWIYSAFNAGFNWATDAFSSFGLSFTGIFISMVVIVSFFRLLLNPIIGSAGSDIAKRMERNKK